MDTSYELLNSISLSKYVKILELSNIKSGAIFTEQPTYALIILLLCLAGGVYFQFSPYANNKPIQKDS